MSNASKYRKKAVEYEQLKQFDRAVASYARAIEENENAGEEVDVALFNKVGDLTLRQGRVTEAVTYYERAVEHYVSNSLFDNAIALCNKILRNAPGRSNVYFTLGRICGRKGLRTDATRNFLEYAQRMQRDGRVDEGMRALAEVADLMPELTEVRRLVEEHAARVGIPLAPRRRNTPPRVQVQSEAEPVRSFAMSKDLVFLEIDYDAVRAAREKTPPPQRSVVAEPAVSAPTPRIASLEDLMIFDPNNSAAGNLPELLDTTVVDGAFILKPYAELTAPVASLDDLEPTELDGTPAYTDAIVAESLHEQSTVSAPVVWVGQIVEPVNDVVTAFADDVVDEVADEVAIAVVDEAITEVVDEVAIAVVNEVVTEVVDEVAIAVVNEVVTEVVDEVVTEVVDEAAIAVVDEVVAEVVDEAVAEVVDEVVTEVVDEVATVVVDEFAVEVVDEGVTEIVDDFVTESVADVETESVDEPHEFVNDFVQPIIDTVAHDVDEPSGVSTFTVEQELQLAAPVEMLDGFTADEAPPAAGAIVITEDVGLVVANVTYNVVHTPEADVLPSLDFDAMLELAPTDVPLVFDLQTDEFALACDELAATHVVRDEDESTARLVDAFESSAQLPPLIFPMPLDYAATGDTHTPELVDAATNLVFLDIQDVDVDVAPPRFTPIELDAVEARRNADDVAFDLLNETDDLDDLFGDTDVPTAIIAAEATLVASSRCSELRAASDAEPDNFGLRRRLGEALLEAGNRSEAITELGAALASAELAELLTDAADIADELVHVAGEELAHHQKRLELAIRLEDETRLRDAYLDLADNLVRRGEDLRARAVYARVLEIDPWDERARTALGDAAPPAPSKPPVAGSDDGHVSLADWLRDDDEPVSTRLRIREPDISGDEQDDFNALLKHFKEGVARSLGEDDYESHYDLGVAYKEMGLLDDAIGEFQMALRSRSNRLAAYEALGQCFIEQRSYKVAVTVLSRALHEPAMQDEQRVGVLYLLGISCEELQRFDEARGYFQRVYATDIHFRDVNQRLADLERTVR